MNIKTNFKYSFPAFRTSMPEGSITVTSGEYTGRRFNSRKEFDDFFFKVMAKKRAEFDERTEQFKLDYKSERQKLKNRFGRR